MLKLTTKNPLKATYSIYLSGNGTIQGAGMVYG
jgi:hypothetical protein